MRGLLERSRKETASTASPYPSTAPILGVGAGVLLLGGAVLAGDGSGNGAIFPIGGAALIMVLATLAAARGGAFRLAQPSRAGLACVGFLIAFAVWSGLSILWSVEPDRSWDYLNRTVAYLALLAVGAVAGSLAPRAATALAAAVAVFAGMALAIGLAVKIFPSLYEDGGRIARLRAPLGYWNVLALLFVLALPAALWLRDLARGRLLLRGVASISLYALLVGLILTFSRGGLLAAVASLALWIAVTERRLDAIAALIAAVPVAALVGGWALSRPGLAEDHQSLAIRIADGHRLALWLVVGAAVVFALGLAVDRTLQMIGPRVRPWRPTNRVRAIVLALGVAVLIAGVAASHPGERIHEFMNPPDVNLEQDASRLTSLSSNHRWTWWQEAWEIFERNPVAGTGAGTFQVAHKQVRVSELEASEAHNLPLQFLSETGIVGAALALCAAVAALFAAVEALRLAERRERPACLVLLAMLVAYLLHSLLDWDFDFLAVTGPVAIATGVLLTTGRPGVNGRPSRALAAGGGILVLALLWSLAAPWLADRRVDQAYDAVAAGNPAVAIERARSARSLDPLSIDPLRAQADAYLSAGEIPSARNALAAAVRLQPENPAPWLELGSFELRIAGRPGAAVGALERAVQLDPHGMAATLLTEARREAG